ncbi:hypothetical protein EVA_08780 [gut metagenome]|uniref:Uncharacterized protein n=1 Tax=gut metagenome TaxID=749906 RepID=J9GSD1_9ZZZZ
MLFFYPSPLSRSLFLLGENLPLLSFFPALQYAQALTESRGFLTPKGIVRFLLSRRQC